METQTILVTGGTGYIGSHAVVELLNQGHKVIVLDNLFNSKEAVLDAIQEITGKRPDFHQVDLKDQDAVDQVFSQYDIDAVIHFAGLKAVAESVREPLAYYENNVGGTINLLQAMSRADVKKIIFSSSACVYGEQETVVYTESMPTGNAGIVNPYGRTKYFVEEILRDAATADPELEVSILRYFNPVGNHESGLIGEDPNGIPNNLMPIIMAVAAGKSPELKIFGTDYPTKDGTAVRDFVHVVDLVKGHVAALNSIKPGVSIYNLGTGQGTSVREMITAFEQASGRQLPTVDAPHRDGDLPEYYADVSKANSELDWRAELSIDDAMISTIKFLQHREDFPQ
jgi:UDP-glucose 4-epimerase